MDTWTPDPETLFRDTAWGRRIVWMLKRYGLPDAIRIEDPEKNPWRVFMGASTIVNVLFSHSFVAPSIEVEQATAEDAEIIENFAERMEKDYSPAMLPAGVLLDLFSRLS